uniref:Caskin-1 n=1 Tax=Syphacia muris TaxID=451379 RepID=A0A0N5ADC0_9BILA
MTSGTLCRRGSPQSRSSLHSSSSGGSASLTSGGASDGFEETPSTSLNPCNAVEDNLVAVPQMVSQGIPETKILAIWLRSIGHPEFLSLFVSQGYDLSTIARMTPEDLTAIGITDPTHRQLLHAEVRSWGLGDSWPSIVPSGSVTEWLQLIGLSEYADMFESQGYTSLIEIQKLNWEDFADIGIKKLGHLKRLELAIKKMKNYRLSRNGMETEKRPVSFDPCHSCYPQSATYHQQVPPPPAPSSTMTFKKTFSPSWPRRASFEPQESSMEMRDSKPVVQVFPSHRSSLPSQAFETCDSRYKNTIANDSDDLSYMATIPRLNLHSPSRILSEVIYAQSNDNDKYPLDGYTDNEGSIVFDDSSACPPPPAPLACEGSIRLLRSAYKNSSELLGLKKYSEPCNPLGAEQIPFANDNCGTIRNRESQRLMSVPTCQPKMSRSSLNNIFNSDLDAAKRRPIVGNCDVLNDIGSMLKNLTDELDAMLLPADSSAYPCEQPSAAKATVQSPNNSGVSS